jgi:hypothetical protein
LNPRMRVRTSGGKSGITSHPFSFFLLNGKGWDKILLLPPTESQP